MSKRFRALALLVLAAAAGCASGPTPYQPALDGGPGYSQTQIEADRFRIAFSGNSMTERETVETYALYRAAELTLEKGFDHFLVVSRDTDADSRTYRSGGFSGMRLSYVYLVPGRGWVGAWEPYWTPSFETTATRFEAFAEIQLRKGPKGPEANAYDARDVMSTLAAGIARPPPPETRPAS
jgi:hypothetical protein